MLHDRRYMGPTGYRHMFRGDGSIIKPLIIANVVVFLLTGLGQETGLVYLLKLHPHYIRRFELWRLGTYMFVHGGTWHILLNMWGLFLFGRPVEQRLGGRRFLQLYFTSGVIGALSWLLFNWGVRVDPATLNRMGKVVDVYGGVVGASGAVFGVMMAAAMMFPNMVIVLIFPPIPMKLKTFVTVYAGIEISQEFFSGRDGRIAHIAHLGGLLGAFLYMRWLFAGQQGPRSLLDDLLFWWERRKAEGRRRRFRTDSRAGPAGGAPTTNEMDRLLDKIGREGLASLTPEERRTLERAREELRDKRGR